MVLSYLRYLLIFSIAVIFATGCARKQTHTIIETTAYCDCGKCCDWQRGSWSRMRLDFWNRYVTKGPQKGKPYSGQTANGVFPREPEAGLLSMDSFYRPWMIPVRILLFPWKFLPHDGTIAADTDYYPFGTRIYVPGYGWGTVEDRGGAIKGPSRIDLFFSSHGRALQWGRRKVRVTIEYPGQ